MIIVDDHLSLLAIAGRLPDFGLEGPLVTTWGCHFRMSRAVADSARSGSLSGKAVDAGLVERWVLHPPADRLVVLDPRPCIDEAVRVAMDHGSNLFLAELVGAAIHHRAAVRVAEPNVGRTWPEIMASEGIDFAVVKV